jgi:hypothetical protein
MNQFPDRDRSPSDPIPAPYADREPPDGIHGYRPHTGEARGLEDVAIRAGDGFDDELDDEDREAPLAGSIPSSSNAPA